MARLNPKDSFIPAVNKAFGESSVIVVKDAQPGAPIKGWYKKWTSATGEKPEKTGHLYDRLMSKVNAAIKDETIATVTFIWMQGESDGKPYFHASVYEASLKGLLDQLKNDLKINTMNFVLGRISDHGIGRYKDWGMIRDIQEKIADESPTGAWIDTDDLNDKVVDGKIVNGKGIHYTRPDGYTKLGQRFADKAIELVKKGEQ